MGKNYLIVVIIITIIIAGTRLVYLWKGKKLLLHALSNVYEKKILYIILYYTQLCYILYYIYYDYDYYSLSQAFYMIKISSLIITKKC